MQDYLQTLVEAGAKLDEALCTATTGAYGEPCEYSAGATAAANGFIGYDRCAAQAATTYHLWSEEATKLAQKLGQLVPFMAEYSYWNTWPTYIFWANLLVAPF